MLGAPPAFVLSQDQTLYKWYLITYKVLNRCNHSDTIACVLYELLVCRSLGFGIVYRDFPSRLRFHKFQYCSIFKVLLALLSDSSINISKVVLFFKHFFDIFLSFPNAFLKAFHPHAVRFPAAFLLVHRFYLAFEELLSCATAYL